MALKDVELRVAHCWVYLKDGKWRPLGASALMRLSAKHRSAPDGPVVYAEARVFVRGDQVVEWGHLQFTARQVDEHGNVEALDLRHALSGVAAHIADTDARTQGVIGINKALHRRKPKPQEWTPTEHDRTNVKALVVAQVRAKVAGQRVPGVLGLS